MKRSLGFIGMCVTFFGFCSWVLGHYGFDILPVIGIVVCVFGIGVGIISFTQALLDVCGVDYEEEEEEE